MNKSDKAGEVVDYDKSYLSSIIIDHPKHGRIYAIQLRENEGSAPSWKDGLAWFAKSDDLLSSFEDMKGGVINDYGCTSYDALLEGYDKERVMISWPSYIIENLIVSAINNN